jgi:hypothetical protein
VSQPPGYPRTPAPLDDDPLTSPSFPAVDAADSRSYRTRRPSRANQEPAHAEPRSGPHPTRGSGGFAGPATQYPVQQAQPQAVLPQAVQPQQAAPPMPPAANPYGSYVSAPQPGYQDVAPARHDVPAYGGHANGQQPDAAWNGGPASGYLPADYNGHGNAQPGGGYGGNGHNGNGHNGNGHNGNGHGYNGTGYVTRDQYGPIDYENLTYQDDYQSAPPAPGGYPPSNQYASQLDERGYGTPEVAYGQDVHQPYPGYGSGRR